MRAHGGQKRLSTGVSEPVRPICEDDHRKGTAGRYARVMDVPRVYRLCSLWRVALTGAGALMGYGAFELVRYVFVFHGSARGGLTVATCLGIGSLYAMWYAGVYRVILAADTITAIRPNLDFLNWGREGHSTRICLYRAEIAGIVRLPSAENPRVLAFIPKVEGAEAAYVSVRRLHTDDYFQQWCDSLPNLDSEDEHVRKYLESDNREYIPKDDPNSAPGSVRVSGWIVLLAVVLAPVLVWKRLRVEASEDSVGLVVAWFAYAAITWFTAWAVTKCLRTGIVTDRNGFQSARRENPVIFWISLTPALLALVMELCIGAFVAYQFWNP